MEIRKNRIKQRLREGKHVIAIENLNDPDLVELFSPNDPHCFWFEGEHSIVNPQNIGDLRVTIIATGFAQSNPADILSSEASSPELDKGAINNSNTSITHPQHQNCNGATSNASKCKQQKHT